MKERMQKRIAPCSFDRIDTLSVMGPNASRPDEIMGIVLVSGGSQPRLPQKLRDPATACQRLMLLEEYI
jgi:hypothetical protein